MKKLVALLLVAAMCFALAACGSAASTTAATEATTAEEPAAAEETAADTTSTGTETITIICPYGVGGVADLIGRKFAEVANGIQTKYNFIVENMTGGDGFVANEYFADEDPMTHDLLVFGYGACYRHDLGKQFGTEEVEWDRHATYPLGTIDDRIWMVYTTPGTTLADILDKAANGGIKMSGGNPLSDPHLMVGSLLSLLDNGSSVQVVPYDGGAQQLQGLLNGEVDIFVGATLAGKDYVESGDIVPILAFSENEFTGFVGPDGEVVSVPTVAGDMKAAELPADIDFTGCILPGGGSLASHVGGDEAFQADMIQLIKDVWNTEEFSGWIADYGLNRFEVYGDDAVDFYNAACEKSVAAYQLLSAG